MNKIKDLIQGNYSPDGYFIVDGYNLFKLNIVGYVGFLILTTVLLLLVSIIPAINFISYLTAPVFIITGYYLVAQRSWANKQYNFGTFFNGFSHPQLGQLVVMNLISGLTVIICFIPGAISLVLWLMTFGTGSFLDTGLPVLSFMLFLIGGIVALYLSVAWIWAPFLILFKEMEAWEALETSRQIISKKWGFFFSFLFMLGLLNLLGVLMLGVGLFVTIPTSILAIYASFERIVGTVEQGEEAEMDAIIKHLVE